MAGLVAYASSDEEDGSSPQIFPSKACTKILSFECDVHPDSQLTSPNQAKLEPAAADQGSQSHLPRLPHHQPSSQPQPPSPSPPPPPTIISPVPLGPSLPPPTAAPLAEPLAEPPPSDEAEAEAEAEAEDTTATANANTNANPPPSSPYSSTRALIHDLTLPSVPNLAIPPSPPRSSPPPPATNTKFRQFLDLKRRGTHFNARLQSSVALRNPSLTDKLLSFADLAGPAQYETTLPADLYDPTSFPGHAHRDGLRKSRDALVKERGGERVSSRGVDFVHASSISTPVGGGGGGGASTGGLSRTEKRKSAWK
ncbi:hypothetical protein E4U41_001975 [Claviceps citrina]|nr:hypothetical protein E4U41_001975 [Claviceps citrina]